MYTIAWNSISALTYVSHPPSMEPIFTKLVTLFGDVLYWTSLSTSSKCFKTLEAQHTTLSYISSFRHFAFLLVLSWMWNKVRCPLAKSTKHNLHSGLLDAHVLEFFASPVRETGHNLFVISPYFAIDRSRNFTGGRHVLMYLEDGADERRNAISRTM
jgi:hypothetical protein